jgi:uncharacterized protein (TIGR02246 family)
MRRFTFYALAFFFSVSLAGLSIAQDAAAPIRRNSPEPDEAAASATPTPSPTPEERPTPPPPTPTPTVEQSAPSTPAPTSTPTPRTSQSTPQPSAAPTEAAKPRRGVLNEEPVRAVEPRTPHKRLSADDRSDNPGASRPTFDLSKRGDGSISTVIRRLEERWQKANREHDVKTISELIAADFVGTSSTGKVGSKATLLAEARRDKNHYTSAEARRMSVRTEGDNVAVVTGVAHVTGTTSDGRRFNTSSRFTDTWVKRDGKWRCIASQNTQIPKK